VIRTPYLLISSQALYH